MTTDSTTTTKPTRAQRAKAPAAAAPIPTPTAVSAPTPAKPTSKSDTVIQLLLRAKGATPLELIAATDWQPHSLRAFLSGLRKKGREVIREERKGGGFAYRIVVQPAPIATTVGGEAAAHASTPAPDNAAEA